MSEPQSNVTQGQFELIYDYVKFHIGLYLATPPVIAVLADAFGATPHRWFGIMMVLMIATFLVAGIHAGIFMGTYINRKWEPDHLSSFEAVAFTRKRRFFHHGTYWIGVVFGILALVIPALD